MNEPRHHIPEPMLLAYAAGRTRLPFAVAFACHISQCDECRARLEAHQALGGIVLDDLPETALTDGLADRVLDLLDTAPSTPATVLRRQGIYPAPLTSFIGKEGPKWQRLGAGVKQAILHSDDQGSLRLLKIPAGQAVPEHGHNGQELTLVLQGGFSDANGQFGVGDLEVADESVDHVPTAWPGLDCICLAVTDAPLRFRGLMPRLLQPIFRI